MTVADELKANLAKREEILAIAKLFNVSYPEAIRIYEEG